MGAGGAGLPPPAAVRRLLIWHQGGLGDLLLSGPAFMAIMEGYPAAEMVAVGHPHRWDLFRDTLPLAAILNGGEALWSGLYQEKAPLAPALRERLAGIGLALVFSPRESPGFLHRLCLGGVAQALWVPSFPLAGGEHATTLQARRLAAWGLPTDSAPFRLRLSDELFQEDSLASLTAPLLAVAPGSGSPGKNWPLSHYFEATRTLAWEKGYQVVWLLGPAEAPVLPYVQGLAVAQEQLVWMGAPLRQVAALLSRTHLYLGGDSGLTHLAAAAGAARVVALFGPTDPRVWAPRGDQVTVLTPPPTGEGRASLAALSVDQVLEAVRRLEGGVAAG